MRRSYGFGVLSPLSFEGKRLQQILCPILSQKAGFVYCYKPRLLIRIIRFVTVKARKPSDIQKKKGGRPAYKGKPAEDDLRRLYKTEGRSVRDIANLLGCSKDIVFRCLKEYMITPRTNARRSRLRQYDLVDLEVGVREKGIRGLARELGIDESTLRHHLKVRKGPQIDAGIVSHNYCYVN